MKKCSSVTIFQGVANRLVFGQLDENGYALTQDGVVESVGHGYTQRWRGLPGKDPAKGMPGRYAVVAVKLLPTTTMSPRSPQELVDYIIDRRDNKTLEVCSTVCKGWTFRSRRYLFEVLYILIPTDLDQWCESIPPTVDGPSEHVNIAQRDVIPLASPSRWINTLITSPLLPKQLNWSCTPSWPSTSGYDAQVFFRVQKYSPTFAFYRLLVQVRGDIPDYRFFPNVDTVIMFLPTLRSDEERPIPPHRPASFLRIRILFCRVLLRIRIHTGDPLRSFITGTTRRQSTRNYNSILYSSGSARAPTHWTTQQVDQVGIG